MRPRAAAERGHKVELFEQSRTLGGQVALAAKAPHRSYVGGIVAWLELEVRRLGVKLRLGVAPDPDEIADLDPDNVIVATGSMPLIDGRQTAEPVRLVSGNLAHVHRPWDVLHGGVTGRSTAFVFDGAGTYDSVSVVERLIEDGYAVTLATRHGSIRAAAPTPEITMAPVRTQFANAAVQHIALATLREITPGDVAVRAGERILRIPADQVVVVGYNELQRDYADYFTDVPFGVNVIGDAAGTHTIADAVTHAWDVARRI